MQRTFREVYWWDLEPRYRFKPRDFAAKDLSKGTRRSENKMDEWCKAAELAVSRTALWSVTSAPTLCSFQKLKRKANCAKSATIEKSIPN